MVLKIELLYFDGCPSHEAFLPHVHKLLAHAHVEVPVEQRRVESAAVRVNRVDIDPGAGERTDFGLKCRLYPTEWRLRGAPPDEWVLDALEHAGRPAG